MKLIDYRYSSSNSKYKFKIDKVEEEEEIVDGVPCPVVTYWLSAGPFQFVIKRNK